MLWLHAEELSSTSILSTGALESGALESGALESGALESGHFCVGVTLQGFISGEGVLLRLAGEVVERVVPGEL